MLNMTIAGTVGKYAVLRKTNNGDAVLGFSIAVDNGKDKNGNKRETTWVHCSIWGKRAESLEQYITKAKKMVLTGRPSVSVYEGKGSLTLSVNDFTFMGGGDRDEAPRQHEEPRNDIDDSDIPF